MSLSGPKALALLQLLILLITWSVVNVTADINDFRFISLDTSRISREEVCLPSFKDLMRSKCKKNREFALPR